MNLNTTYFMGLLFVFIRMISYFSFVNVFFPKGFPNKGKIAFAAIIAFVIMPGINLDNFSIAGDYDLFIAIASEVITGLILGYFTNLCFNAIRFAGQIIDMEIGFGMLSLYDPSTNTNATFIENMFYWLALMVFFITSTHHILITELVNSFQVIGLGKFILSDYSINFIVKVFVEYFAIGLKIAMPIVIIILATDLIMGLIARTVPQLNVMILGLPIKIVLGLICVSISLPVIAKAIVTNFNNLPSMFNELFKLVPLVLIFANEDKTEDATPKKKQQAKEKGQVAKSKELSLSFTLLASTLVIAMLSPYIWQKLETFMFAILSNFINMNITDESVLRIITYAIGQLALMILPFVVPIMIIGVVGNIVQTGFMLVKEPLKPQLNKINPLKGLKRMFSMRSLVELLKNLALVGVVGYVGYDYLSSNFNSILNIANLSFDEIVALFKKLVVGAFTKVTVVMIIISIVDFMYQRRSYNKELKMTKQEIKEEMKQQEGDPQIKGKIRQKQREMASRRMMSEVPNATVIVTNPTHIAVALKYIDGENSAPILVAKGSDKVALRIKEIAGENNIPIIENKPLARLIYKDVELNDEIPAEMYQAIAEILALVFKMKR